MNIDDRLATDQRPTTDLTLRNISPYPHHNLIVGGVFGDGGSNGAISGWTKSKMPAGGHFEKSSSHISAMHCPIHFVHIPHFALGHYSDCSRI